MENTKGDFFKVFYEYDITEQYENDKIRTHRKAEFETTDRETADRVLGKLEFCENITAIRTEGF